MDNKILGEIDSDITTYGTIEEVVDDTMVYKNIIKNDTKDTIALDTIKRITTKDLAKVVDVDTTYEKKEVAKGCMEAWSPLAQL